MTADDVSLDVRAAGLGNLPRGSTATRLGWRHTHPNAFSLTLAVSEEPIRMFWPLAMLVQPILMELPTEYGHAEAMPEMVYNMTFVRFRTGDSRQLEFRIRRGDLLRFVQAVNRNRTEFGLAPLDAPS